MMTRTHLLTLAAGAALAAAGLAQSPFTIGNVVVSRVGDGSAALTTAAQQIFLDEYTPGGTFVQTIPLPTVDSGPNRAIVIRGSATSEGYLNLSANGIALTVCGYNASVGAPASATTDEIAQNVNRVIARIDLLGGVDTSTALSDAYSAANFRSACSDDGNRFWIAGSNEGTRFVANVGDTTSLLINGGAPVNMRVANIYNGDLYVTSASTGAGTLGPVQVGTGLPTTPGQVQTLLPGFPTGPSTAAGSPYDLFFADPNTLYVCDDNAVASTVGGIQKWTFNGTVWTRQYNLRLGGPTANTAARAVTGFVQNGVTTLWAIVNTTSAGSAQTELCVVTDTGPNSVVTSLVTSPVNTAFRGVRYLGKPTTLQRIGGIACGSADIKASGNGQIGTTVRTTVLNPVGIPLINYGTTFLAAPVCTCTVLTDVGFLVTGPAHALQLPNNAALIGAQVFIQGVDFLDPAATSCPLLPFATLTDGYVFTVQ